MGWPVIRVNKCRFQMRPTRCPPVALAPKTHCPAHRLKTSIHPSPKDLSRAPYHTKYHAAGAGQGSGWIATNPLYYQVACTSFTVSGQYVANKCFGLCKFLSALTNPKSYATKGWGSEFDFPCVSSSPSFVPVTNQADSISRYLQLNINFQPKESTQHVPSQATTVFRSFFNSLYFAWRSEYAFSDSSFYFKSSFIIPSRKSVRRDASL
jgi:hypothetical protein